MLNIADLVVKRPIYVTIPTDFIVISQDYFKKC